MRDGSRNGTNLWRGVSAALSPRGRRWERGGPGFKRRRAAVAPGPAAMAGPGAPRPLRGKSFYLDLPSGRGARELAAAIRRLGGVTESFLSKEVSYVVSSNKEAKRDKARTQPEKRSNGASEDAKATGPMPSTSKGNHPRPHQKPSDTVRAIKV
uniref:BRCT domain-containing protein n=1 Tax=Strigops habroptila TaxID=2489341 RepID=A0A672TG45_STRHB